jgi:SNF2 family DNA or RNA helicase
VRYETLALQAPKGFSVEHVLAELDPALAAELCATDDIEAQLESLESSKAFSTLRKLCGMAKVDPLADLLDIELQSGLERVVVMAHHSAVVDGLAERLAGHGVATITGSTPSARRQTIVSDFQAGKIRVVVCNIVAGGTGITLTAASELVFAEMSFVPGENAQAADRIHRIGQANACRVRFAMLDGTLDEAIVGVLQRKTLAIFEVMDKKCAGSS